MSRNWISKEVVLNGTNQAVAASQTDQVVSEVFRVGDPRYIVVDVTAASVTVTNAITVKLQDSDGSDVWHVKGTQGSASITGNGTVTIKLMIENADDQAQLPLRPLIRVGVTTGVDDAATITKVRVSYYA